MARDGLILAGSFFILCSVIGGTEARAIDLRSADQPKQAWMDEKEYQSCGQNCHYEKANENLSLQALYLVTKINQLGDELDNNPAKVLESIKEYCPTHQDDAKKCYQEYLAVEIPQLEKLKSAMLTNSKGTTQLNSSSPAAPRFEAPNSPGKKPLVTYVPTIKDLAAESAVMKDITSQQYQDWVNSRLSPPSPDDYPLFETVPRDPKNPALGNLTVVKTTPDGKPMSDPAAYRAALDSWTKSNGIYKEDWTRDAHALHDTKNMKDAKADFEKEKLPEIDKKAFDDSRKTIVKTANKMIREAGLTIHKEFSFPGRTPAQQGAKSAPKTPTSYSQGQTNVPQGQPSSAPVVKEDADLNGGKVYDVEKQKGKESLYSIVYDAKDFQKDIDKIHDLKKNLEQPAPAATP